MKTVAHQHREVNYSPVYLSGLRPLMDIYRKHYTDTTLNTGFGLPLIQASRGNEVLGFSSVSISEEGTLVIRYFGIAGFDSIPIREELEQRGRQELQHSFGKVHDVETMRAQIVKLIGWLNNCN